MALSDLRVTIDDASMSTKLRAGYGARSSESAEISELLKLAEKDLETYEAELHRLHMRSLTVNSQKILLENYMEKLRSLQAPIRNLPNELLLRILTFCCDGDDGYYSGSIPTALVIGEVCTHWRELINAEPSVWTRFAVTFCSDERFDNDNLEGDSALSQVKGYLELSKDKSLSIRVTAGYWGLEIPSEHPGFELLLTQSHRLRNLSFEGDFSSSSHAGLFSNPSMALSALEVLKIDMRDYGEHSSAELDIFKDASCLRTLSLFASVDMNTTQDFPWAQITTIELDASYMNVYNVLVLCHNLEDLKLHACYGSQTAYEVPDVAFTLEHVVSFSVIGDFGVTTSDVIEAILSSFVFPSLRSLKLTQWGFVRQSYWPKDQVTNLLARSRCSLTLLSLCGLRLSDIDLVALLKHLPSLQELFIHDVLATKFLITTSLIKSLHGIRPSNLHTSFQPLVPHLRTLSLVVKNGDDFDATAFVETISSRWLPEPEYTTSVGRSCLQSVELVIHNRKEDLNLFAPLTHLEKAGMRVFVAKCEEVKRFKAFESIRCALCRH